MSTNGLRKPSRPPPPPPVNNKANNDYIKISDCHTGLPVMPPKPSRPMGFKSHQKSRSLTDTYLYLDLPSHSKNNCEIDTGCSSIVYNEVDISKTEALIKCKAMRDGAHHQRGSVSLTRIRPTGGFGSDSHDKLSYLRLLPGSGTLDHIKGNKQQL